MRLPQNADKERVKACLKCDQLIPFDARKCPYCKGDQASGTGRNCAQCSTALPKGALFCPICGALSIAVAATPLPHSFQAGTPEKDVTSYDTRILFACGFLLLVQAWLIFDFLIS